MSRSWFGGLALLGACAALCPLTASAQPMPPFEAWHFGADASRHARVDDRGGLGEGYSFSIEYDETDGNSEDFCPHCRFNVLVSDPGIDLAELEAVGIQRSDLGTAAGVLSALQSVTTMDPTGLAMMLNPGVSLDDLQDVIAEITATQERAAAAVTALETLATIATTFDWSTATIDTLISELALHMDTAFRGDFSDPNDPRIHNSGVAVYGVPELVMALGAIGVDMSTQMAIQAALTSIPGASGTLEISGDDSSPTDPIQFHGYHTDVTVRLRTYAVNGVSAYLLVYTLVNETSRVFPFVETAMIADFDIPPLGYDTSTEFDPANQMVALYDQIPYTDPEVHYWFGLAPALATPGGPGGFSFANWNVDKNFTLAQWGSSTTQDNRYRFFLWDPALSGDHDDAVGKSEKQGAISMVLDGPLLPGDQRSVAFCYAAGTGGSSGAARAELTAIMASCRAIYTAINPNCGDGVVQFPEECDGGPDCTARCQALVCGDGRVDEPEQCDDGNTMGADGCTATCQREECGNGVVDPLEECDDGNASNSDACLNSCHVASCGDGFVRAAMGCTGPGCGCAGYEYCLSGRFTVGTAPRGSHFYALAGTPVDFQMGFDAAMIDTTALSLESGIRITTGPVHVEMTGGRDATAIANALEGSTWRFDMRNSPRPLSHRFNTSVLSGAYDHGMVGFELWSDDTRGLTWGIRRDGLPDLAGLRMTVGTARLTYTQAGLPASDTVTGTARANMGSIPVGMGGELCDDGNASDFDACTNSCVPAACGDGIVQASEGEQCDVGSGTATWCVGCLRVGSSCGNGTLEPTEGEECDDGNTTGDDGCSATCVTEICGDGVTQSDEECDDGANGDGDGCTDGCVLEVCGDGVLQPGLGEVCDTGAMIADTAACTAACQDGVCGDGLVLAGVEECDDANDVDGDGCTSGCVLEVCGDGLPGPDEECDDGNDVERDGCSPVCTYEVCGDGRPGPMEQCDDGNLLDGDGCDKDCILENPEACGDGNVTTGEQCDDGGNANGDGCSEFCQLEDPDACGDGTQGPGEACDDGNHTGGDGCSAICALEVCGDGIQARGEQCDDGNDRNGDGCSSNCVREPTECGNGVQEYGEQCDGESNCDDMCRATDRAPLGETCGNGMQDYGEQCDDGGRMDGNGCDELCQLEASVCGNNRMEFGETCDDGNADAGDGCGSDCLIEGREPPVVVVVPPADGCGGCAVPREGSRTPWILAGLLGLALLRRRRGA
ncbi:MAG: DUF4215 domain-containing protein [Sandaracinaceae bacterium]